MSETDTLIEFERNVFVNCPFDDEYLPMLRAAIFALVECGLNPRIATERDDSGEARLQKIKALIRESRLSIHDVSRMESESAGELARFNMPFELGLDLGCREYGEDQSRRKQCLILDEEPFRYQRAISDLAGYDPKHHRGEPERLVKVLRNWVRGVSQSPLPSGTTIWERYLLFEAAFVETTNAANYRDEDRDEMPVTEYIGFILSWQQTPT